MSNLFSPITLRGGVRLANRIVMAPMTRSRATEADELQTPFAPEYYAQRATAGLVITEATNISREGKGYSKTPGVHTDAHQEAWSAVASAVHEAVKGSVVFMQMWHVGRVSVQEVSGLQPVAPSAVTAEGSVWVERADGWSGLVDCDAPRELSVEDIDRIVGDFADAADRAVAAGMDGVELHGANGYLIDQFMRRGTNKRTDEFGGSLENRLRFLGRVTEAVAERIGADKVGVRLSPIVSFPDGGDDDIEDTIVAAARLLDGHGIAYLHIAEYDYSWPEPIPVDPEFRKQLRSAFAGPIVVAGNYDRRRADEVLETGLVDLVAFGRPFIGNPDLPARLRDGIALAESDRSTWYGGGAEGYTDYPAV
ncbi:alkene reductase [Nocardioides cavernae]|uniref:Alkene reductase n=1 Tax=Nocardioides cavernae TaxID=1921566 RepID=A0ABR8N7W3_9ACTN|nr:alkene reductase [Nocardioides cavernae]MBD3924243.1 alkene reductase [Nocardioides cavernae]MBM7510818.1 N-ethylmaleimide reductase [Nocardioides cavernae]